MFWISFCFSLNFSDSLIVRLSSSAESLLTKLDLGGKPGGTGELFAYFISLRLNGNIFEWKPIEADVLLSSFLTFKVSNGEFSRPLQEKLV